MKYLTLGLDVITGLLAPIILFAIPYILQLTKRMAVQDQRITALEKDSVARTRIERILLSQNKKLSIQVAVLQTQLEIQNKSTEKRFDRLEELLSK